MLSEDRALVSSFDSGAASVITVGIEAITFHIAFVVYCVLNSQHLVLFRSQNWLPFGEETMS